MDYEYDYQPRRRKQGGSFWVAFFTSIFVAAGTSVAMHLWVIPMLAKTSWFPNVQPQTEVFVPQLTGLSHTRATSVLKAQGLRIHFAERKFAQQPAGTILSQTPNAGTRIQQGRTVEVILSLGPTTASPSPTTPTQPTPSPPRNAQRPTPPPTPARSPASETLVRVPSLYHVNLSTAKQRILRAGLVVGRISYSADEDVGPLKVLRQSPNAGTRIPRNSPVDLVVNREDL